MSRTKNVVHQSQIAPPIASPDNSGLYWTQG